MNSYGKKADPNLSYPPIMSIFYEIIFKNIIIARV